MAKGDLDTLRVVVVVVVGLLSKCRNEPSSNEEFSCGRTCRRHQKLPRVDQVWSVCTQEIQIGAKFRMEFRPFDDGA